MNRWLQRSVILGILACIASLLIPVVIFFKTAYRPELSEAERTVANFSPAQFDVATKTWQPTALRQPVTRGTQPAGTAAAPNAVQTPPPAPPPTLSFVLQDGSKSMAIIDGNMVKTGSEVRGWTVIKIEQNRVLLRNRKGTRWLKMD